MSTSANVGIVYEDGTIDTIYVHSDGYLEHTGKVLRENYTTPEQIKELMQLGDLSILGERIGEKQDFTKWDRVSCLAYHRDRNEPWASVAPVEYGNLESDLSPENLCCDGELPMAEVRKRSRLFNAAKDELEAL